MATATKIATAAAVAAGSPFNGSWTNEQNARVAVTDLNAAGSGTYATAAPGKNQEFASLWPFVFSDVVGAGDTIDSVSIKVQWKVSTTSSVATARSTCFADNGAGAPDQATALSAAPGFNDTTEPTADKDSTYTATCTAAQVRQGVWVRVQALRGNTNTAVTFSLDYIQVTVNYTAAPAGVTGTGAVAFGLSEAATGKETFAASGGAAFGFSTAATSKETFSGTSAESFTFSLAGTGTVPDTAVTGTGAVAFGFSLAASGAETFAGSAAVAFPFSTAAEAKENFTGSGGAAFAFSTDSDGAETFSASGDTTFGFSLDATGTVPSDSFTGTGGVEFAADLDATAVQSFIASGGVAFGASLAADGAQEFTAEAAVEFGFRVSGSSYGPITYLRRRTVSIGTDGVSIG